MTEQTGGPTPVSMLNRGQSSFQMPFQAPGASPTTSSADNSWMAPLFQQAMSQQPSNTYNFDLSGWDQAQQQVQSPIAAPPAAPQPAAAPAPAAPQPNPEPYVNPYTALINRISQDPNYGW